MKGCLKSPAPCTGRATQTRKCKCVAFGEEGSEEVYLADVWDRTPTEPARRLSYEDLLELKEIQCSLPRANQQADPVSGRPASQFLSGVPIGLLPLLPPGQTPSSASDPPSTSSIVSPQPTWPQRQATPAPTPRTQPHLSHLLPANPPAQRQKPRFSFLPLLDSPSPTATPPSPPPSPLQRPSYDSDASTLDPPTPSLTSASGGSSPPSRSSSTSPEPYFFTLPPPRNSGRSLDNNKGFLKHHFGPTELEFVSPVPSVYSSGPSGNADTSSRRWTKWTPPPPPLEDVQSNPKPIQRRKRNIIVVNGVEIPIDDDEEDVKSPVRLATPTMPAGVLSPTSTRLSTSPTSTKVSPPRGATSPSSKGITSPPKANSPISPSSPARIPILPLLPPPKQGTSPPSKPPTSPTYSPKTPKRPISPSVTTITRTASPTIRTTSPSPSPPAGCGRQTCSPIHPFQRQRDSGRRGPVVI